MYPYAKETMERVMTGTATTFDISKHPSLKVFVTSYGKAPQRIGDMEVGGLIQEEERTLGTSYDGNGRRVWCPRVRSVVSMKAAVITRNAFRSPGRVEDVPV